MTATTEKLRTRTTRLRSGAGQTGVLESILEAADGPWLGDLDVDGRGTAELRMHLAGCYRFAAVVTSAGKLSEVRMTDTDGDRTLSTKLANRRGWDTEKMPKPPTWLDYALNWVSTASLSVDRRAVIEWHLTGADRRLAGMDDTIDSMRASLHEREHLRAQLAAEIAALRAEMDALPQPVR
ncbi:hypothetical protein [Nocardia sp. NPDC051832]|uniref:hypothetical protein n=1 Tax=Nocardia sp. NPDC051832 TaxID=3155673 RepID=UPI003427D321